MRIIAWFAGKTDLPVVGRIIRFFGNVYTRYIIFGKIHLGSVHNHQHTIIDHDSAIELIQREKDLCVIDCICRKIGKNCDFPLKTCILVGSGARVRNGVNPGLKVTVEEATHILKSCFDQNLIHNAIYTLGQLVEVCNCCSCCCVPILGVRQGIKSLQPSNYLATRTCDCKMCGICETICPFGAINKGKINAEKCYGCGLCAYKCPEGSIIMVKLR